MGDEQDQGQEAGETSTDVTTPAGTEVHEEQAGQDAPAPDPESDGE